MPRQNVPSPALHSRPEWRRVVPELSPRTPMQHTPPPPTPSQPPPSRSQGTSHVTSQDTSPSLDQAKTTPRQGKAAWNSPKFSTRATVRAPTSRRSSLPSPWPSSVSPRSWAQRESWLSAEPSSMQQRQRPKPASPREPLVAIPVSLAMHAGESPLRLGEYYDATYNRSLYHLSVLAARTLQRAMRAAAGRRSLAKQQRARDDAVLTLQRYARRWLVRLHRQSGVVDIKLQIFTAALERSMQSLGRRRSRRGSHGGSENADAAFATKASTAGDRECGSPGAGGAGAAEAAKAHARSRAVGASVGGGWEGCGLPSTPSARAPPRPAVTWADRASTHEAATLQSAVVARGSRTATPRPTLTSRSAAAPMAATPGTSRAPRTPFGAFHGTPHGTSGPVTARSAQNCGSLALTPARPLLEDHQLLLEERLRVVLRSWIAPAVPKALRSWLLHWRARRRKTDAWQKAVEGADRLGAASGWHAFRSRRRLARRRAARAAAIEKVASCCAMLRWRAMRLQQRNGREQLRSAAVYWASRGRELARAAWCVWSAAATLGVQESKRREGHRKRADAACRHSIWRGWVAACRTWRSGQQQQRSRVRGRRTLMHSPHAPPFAAHPFPLLTRRRGAARRRAPRPRLAARWSSGGRGPRTPCRSSGAGGSARCAGWASSTAIAAAICGRWRGGRRHSSGGGCFILASSTTS